MNKPDTKRKTKANQYIRRYEPYMVEYPIFQRRIEANLGVGSNYSRTSFPAIDLCCSRFLVLVECQYICSEVI